MTKPFKLIRSTLGSTALMSVLAFGVPAAAFCGFYVAKGGTDLFNESSKVVLVRDGDRTVITMANDYQGEPTEFAMVIPVPTVITKEQVHISKASILDHLDAYTAPRLVEYFDPDPCVPPQSELRMMSRMTVNPPVTMDVTRVEAESLGVTIEESFSVGEYDILILSAKESDGLQTWLTDNGYQLPKGAGNILRSYIRQDMKFFVAKVNLEEKAKIGGEMLRPIAVAFESPKFMLPIRLGTLNSKGTQDLFVYALTKNGRVETTNYRTQKIPSDKEIPVFVKDDFGTFYKDMYGETVRKQGGNGVFMEYAWDMGWCDPCAADPLSNEELRELGVFWLGDVDKPTPVQKRRVMPRRSQANNVYVTRLHVRYDAQSFPEDLKFHETGNRKNFQGRYIMRHPYQGEMTCEAALDYKKQVNKRLDKEINTLANLTGWERTYINGKIDKNGKGKKFNLENNPKKNDWWNRIWPDD
ncbi:MAG: DUF2330 domain-containing protein [Robiginitomaculum sp.]